VRRTTKKLKAYLLFNVEEKSKNRACAITTGYLRLQCRHSDNDV